MNVGRLRAFALAASALLAVGCGGSSAPPTVTLHVALKSAHYRLPNGLEVVLHEDRTMRTAVVNVRYHVGGKDDPAGRSGFAHLYEHLMFLGSQKVSEQGFSEALDDVGALEYNASTTQDATEYYERVPAGALATALWLEADRMATPLDRLTSTSFDRERDVVKNEWRQRYDNQPYGHVHALTRAAIFPAGHPYHLPPIGLPEELDKATVDEAKAFGTKFYVPNNATLVVTGDIDVEQTKGLISTYFGAIPAGGALTARSFPFPHLEKDVRVSVEADVDRPRVVIAWPAPPPYSAGWSETLFALQKISGLTSWKLENQSKVARDVSSAVDPGRLGSVLSITIDLADAGAVDAAIAAVETRVDWMSNTSRTSTFWSDFADRRTQQMTRTVFGLASNVGRAERLQDYAEYYGDPDSAQNDLRRIQAIRSSDATAATQAFFHDAGKVVVVVTPTRGAPRAGRMAAR
jgi:predicted Zn-dependent peptidase